MINLTKGQGIDLVKKGNNLHRVNVALGWAENKKGVLARLFGNAQDIDCDVSAACIGKNGKLISTKEVVYYGNRNTNGIRHSGDDLVGGGNKDNETISITFDDVKPSVESIKVFMNIYDARERDQSLGDLHDAYIRVYNADTNEELCRYNLDGDYSSDDEGFIAGELNRTNDGWAFKAIGEAVRNASRIDQIINKYW
jgi:stress response protein SCP2